MSNDAFDAFWGAFPLKVGKLAARKSFQKAIRQTDIETILAAVEKYKRCKPDWQHFCHPTSWLNQGRWEDDWTEPAKPFTGGSPKTFDYKPSGEKVLHLPKRTTAFLKAWDRGEFKKEG